MIFRCFQRVDGWCESTAREVRTGLRVLYRKHFAGRIQRLPPLKALSVPKVEWAN